MLTFVTSLDFMPLFITDPVAILSACASNSRNFPLLLMQLASLACLLHLHNNCNSLYTSLPWVWVLLFLLYQRPTVPHSLTYSLSQSFYLFPGDVKERAEKIATSEVKELDTEIYFSFTTTGRNCRSQSPFRKSLHDTMVGLVTKWEMKAKGTKREAK